jgi:hypothetical protein
MEEPSKKNISGIGSRTADIVRRPRHQRARRRLRVHVFITVTTGIGSNNQHTRNQFRNLRKFERFSNSTV